MQQIKQQVASQSMTRGSLAAPSRKAGLVVHATSAPGDRPSGAGRFDMPASLNAGTSTDPSSVSRPGGGASRSSYDGLSTSYKGAPGVISFDRPGGGALRFNVGSPVTAIPATGGPGGSSGGSGGAGGSGGSGSSGSGDSPASFSASAFAPWALLYMGICAGAYVFYEKVIKKPVKKCCGCKKAKAAAVADTA